MDRRTNGHHIWTWINKFTDRHRDIGTKGEIYSWQIDRCTGGQIDRRTDRQMYIKTDKQMDIKTER